MSPGPDLRSLHASGELDLALPGAGSTVARLSALSDLARRLPVGVARLAEAHTDAVAILAEARREPVQGALYGVWASNSPSQCVVFDATKQRLSGEMGFASGLGLVDRALVTARTPKGTVLVDVDVSLGQISVDADLAAWSTPALADTSTGPVTFTEHEVPMDSVVGGPGWYLDRPGFWHGACAPAACWAGAALGLIDIAASHTDDNPHRRAHHGALVAHGWTLSALLEVAGRQIDSTPTSTRAGEVVARSLRFGVADICRDVLDRFGRAYGPRPFVSDAATAQRALDLDLYIKQHHSERELPRISELSRVSD